MATPYKSGGVDFDALFDPYVTGTYAPVTNRRIGGVDLNQRYAPIQFGTKGPDVGYRVGGVDISNFFAAFGTARYVAADAGLPSSIIDYQVSPSGPVTSTASFQLYRDGTTAWFPSGTGEWYSSAPPTIGDDYDAEFSIVSGNSAGTLSGSALNTRLRLDSARGLTLAVTRTTSGAIRATRQIRVRIYRRSDSAIVATTFVTLQAEADIS